LDAEFTHGTVAIDKNGVLTDTLLCGEAKVKVTVVIPQGALGDYTSFDHQKLWQAYRAAQGRVEALVKEKCSGLPTEACTITLEKSDLQTH
jgi:hypothetical protein